MTTIYLLAANLSIIILEKKHFLVNLKNYKKIETYFSLFKLKRKNVEKRDYCLFIKRKFQDVLYRISNITKNTLW